MKEVHKGQLSYWISMYFEIFRIPAEGNRLFRRWRLLPQARRANHMRI